MRLKQLRQITDPKYLACWHFYNYANLVRRARGIVEDAQERADDLRQQAKTELAAFKAMDLADSGLSPKQQLEACQEFILEANRRRYGRPEAAIEAKSLKMMENMERVRSQLPDAITRAMHLDDLYARLGVSSTTIYNWRDEFPEFNTWFVAQVEQERTRRGDPNLFRHGRTDFGHSALIKDILRRK